MVIDYTESDLLALIDSAAAPFPELQTLLDNPEVVIRTKPAQTVLNAATALAADLTRIPDLTPELYQQSLQTRRRDLYDTPYSLRREKLSVTALLLALGQADLAGMVEQYLAAICREATWVIPAHDGRLIDLYAADTALVLAEVLTLVGDKLDAQIVAQVRRTINERIFKPYLTQTDQHRWYKNHDNWNAVCNSEIVSSLLLLETDPQRRARGVKLALESLQIYLDQAFNEDGSTSEGIGYWHYGLSMLVVFSEYLYACTAGQINLLNADRVRQIATFPAKIQLSRQQFATFSDTKTEVTLDMFHPGIMQRLAERTDEVSLWALIDPAAQPDWLGITSALRFILWWDGQTGEQYTLADSLLPNAGIARLTANTPQGGSLAFIIKAGHNDENHNHNDIGSFILNVAGESLLTDPGAGLYDLDYFSEKRYENIFANSYGHSVPRIDGKLQGTGAAFSGTLTTINGQSMKGAVVDFAGAYDLKSLTGLTRTVQLDLDADGTYDSMLLEDGFQFAGKSLPIEAAFVTWFPVEIDGTQAMIRGQKHTLRLNIEEASADWAFSLESLTGHSKANGKEKILQRICLQLPASERSEVAVKIRINIEKL